VDATIHVEGITKRFGDVEALRGVDLKVQPGTVFGLLGPNGAGKTTMVRILTTLLQPDDGQATVAGYDVVRDAEALRHVIGLAGQYAAIDENLTGQENLDMVGRLYHLTAEEASRRSEAVLERFELTDAAHRIAKTYSGGMRRRLDLGASLVGRPQVLFLDEPTTGLDPRSRLEMWDIIRELVRDGTTLLLTTQYMDEADQLADEIVVIDHGKVIAAGTSKELKMRVGGQVVVAQPVDPSDVATTRRVLEPFARDDDAIHADGEVVRLSIADGVQLGQVARRLDDEGIQMDELALRRPSLDEVFLAITGHVTEVEELEADTGAERRST
jgi:daunorubicin resistance ABC transporter ATP-binding subunit